ncbi:unnamed protein product [Protopolystoma xenopodis]|uniref:Uncharacterized protein n=1 Tax=Protopolystoma xenopodis TaxID=117903 RepID=A0A448WG53_9PLAT|nr:unnamed protein product [Protopolystoma xenopodis]
MCYARTACTINPTSIMETKVQHVLPRQSMHRGMEKSISSEARVHSEACIHLYISVHSFWLDTNLIVTNSASGRRLWKFGSGRGLPSAVLDDDGLDLTGAEQTLETQFSGRGVPTAISEGLFEEKENIFMDFMLRVAENTTRETAAAVMPGYEWEQSISDLSVEGDQKGAPLGLQLFQSSLLHDKSVEKRNLSEAVFGNGSGHKLDEGDRHPRHSEDYFYVSKEIEPTSDKRRYPGKNVTQSVEMANKRRLAGQVTKPCQNGANKSGKLIDLAESV